MKSFIYTFISAMAGVVASFLGGWSFAIQTLIVFMVIDYITGIIVAGVFKNSTKTKNGSLKSIAGFKGICKKVCILLAVGVAVRLDKIAGTDFVHNTVIIAYCINELISIIENWGLMGLYVPPQLQKAIEILSENNKGE